MFSANGDGTFTKIILSEDLYLQGDNCLLYIGDFNGDGMSDFVKYWGNDYWDVYIGNGAGGSSIVNL